MIGSVTSAILSLITYVQSIILSVNLPKLILIKDFKKIMKQILFFVTSLISLIPTFPEFDLRANLYITGIIIPFILDFLITPLMPSVLNSFLHFFDILCLFIVGGISAAGLYTKFNVMMYVLVGLTAAFPIGHFIWFIFKYKMPKNKDNVLGDAASDYFLDGIVPGKSKLNLITEESKEIYDYIEAVTPIQEQPSIWKGILMLLGGLVLVGVTIIVMGIVNLGIIFPSFVRFFIPVVTIPSAIVLITLSFFKFTAHGIGALNKVKGFLKTSGFRFVLLVLEILYVPILAALAENLIPIEFTCPFELDPFVVISSSPYNAFEKHSFACKFNMSIGEQPVGYFQNLRMASDYASLFYRDVLKVCIVGLLFVVIFIMFGLPFIWNKVININRIILPHINAYGTTVDEKWNTIAKRLKTSGLCFFDRFSWGTPKWGFLIWGVKTLVLLSNIAASVYSLNFILIDPVCFATMAVLTAIKKPYKHRSNNYLDIVLYSFNFILSIFPVLRAFNIKIPADILSYVIISLMGAPFLSLFYFIFAHEKEEDNDPTVITPDLNKIINQQRGLADDELVQDSLSDETSASCEYITNFLDEEKLIETENCVIPENGLISIDDLVNERCSLSIKMQHLLVSQKVTEMFQVLDLVIDKQTFVILGIALNVSGIFAAGAIGFYLISIDNNTNMYIRKMIKPM